MNCTESQFRGFLREEAADIAEESVPPLWLPKREPAERPGSRDVGARGRQRWLVPLGAAAAVTAIVLAATIVAGAGRPSGPTATVPGLWHGVPRYYFLVTQGGGPHQPDPKVIVDSARSGTTLATGQLRCDSFEGVQVSAAADDRTFAIACSVEGKPGSDGFLPARLYLARFDSATSRLSLTSMRLPLIPGSSSIALSPDGTRIAALFHAGSTARATVILRVYSIATAAVRQWKATNALLAGQAAVSWVSGRRLAFVYPVARNFFTRQLPGSGIRLLDIDARPGSLVGASRLAVPATHLPGGYLRLGSLAISGNGANAATVLSERSGNLSASEFAEFSLATGTLIRRWLPSQGETVIWSDVTGKKLAVFGQVPGPGDIPKSTYIGIMTGKEPMRLPQPHQPRGSHVPASAIGF
jgi:hypothetical protein